ncbi:MAG TPA: twin-arginine translocase subunit TatC, partial [Actinoplanes sp.]|nr:twin-arginine translocase subunit TatC [Actinoplanes sp.]
MAFSLRRQGPSKFARAADGSMTLLEHVRELRNRLFWAALGVLVGLIAGFILAQSVFDLLKEPYCGLETAIDEFGNCKDVFQMSPATGFLIKLKIALWVGLVLSAPVWLFQ